MSEFTDMIFTISSHFVFKFNVKFHVLNSIVVFSKLAVNEVKYFPQIFFYNSCSFQ